MRGKLASDCSVLYVYEDKRDTADPYSTKAPTFRDQATWLFLPLEAVTFQPRAGCEYEYVVSWSSTSGELEAEMHELPPRRAAPCLCTLLVLVRSSTQVDALGCMQSANRAVASFSRAGSARCPTNLLGVDNARKPIKAESYRSVEYSYICIM